MSSSTFDSSSVSLRQQKLRERIDDDMAKVLNKSPGSLVDAYSQYVATSGDWALEDVGQLALPLSLCQMIPLQLRDRGNSLIERTVVLNNQLSSFSFRTAEVLLVTDAEMLELRAEIVDWGMDIAKEVAFKLRYQAKSDPVRAFFSAFDGFICKLDDTIAHCPKSVFPFAWSALIDIIVSELFDTIVLKPGHIVVEHDTSERHLPNLSFASTVRRSADLDRLEKVFNLYAMEPTLYAQNVVLKPLLAFLKTDPSFKVPANYQVLCHQMVSDLVEAAPYLMSSDRSERYMFQVAGTTCFATINFISAHGCGRFVFGDDELYVLKGLHSNMFRTALNIGQDGQISAWGHRGKTLARAFGDQDGMLLAYWLLKQVHTRMLKDYLSIEHYYLNSGTRPTAETEAETESEDLLAYVAWAKIKDAQAAASRDDEAPPLEEPPDQKNIGSLPHLRRQYFFKMLTKCGAQIEQGKGSEFKLLRPGKHPFRLGSHNGTNPTIPSFLAAAILKRLEISRQEWLDALEGG